MARLRDEEWGEREKVVNLFSGVTLGLIDEYDTCFQNLCRCTVSVLSCVVANFCVRQCLCSALPLHSICDNVHLQHVYIVHSATEKIVDVEKIKQSLHAFRWANTKPFAIQQPGWTSD